MGKTRKWDDPMPRSREKCLEAAKEAAARVFSRLVAEGKASIPDKTVEPPLMVAKKEPVPKLEATSVVDQPFTCDIEINDIPYACRNLLTKSVTQEDILKASGAKVATRGRFMTSEEKELAKDTNERPLYLSVQGPNQQSVDVAVQRVSNIINSMCNVPLVSLSISSGTTNIKSLMSAASMAASATPALAFVQDKLFVGLEHAPPSFDVKQKITGPNGSYLMHIQSETSAKVMLRGKGSGFIEPTSGREAFEPMYIYLQHSNQVGLQRAKQLAQNLLETVQKEYADFQQALALAPPAINPGMASILAGLQQPAFPPASPMWNSPVPPGSNYSPGFPYPPHVNPSGKMSYERLLPPPSFRMMGGAVHQQPYVFPSYNGTPLFAPPPPPSLPAPPQSQISSVSAALNYYEQYLPPPDRGAPDPIGDAEKFDPVGRTSPPSTERQGSSLLARRKFQEKVDDDDEDQAGSFVENDELAESSSSPSSSSSFSKGDDAKKDHSRSGSISSIPIPNYPARSSSDPDRVMMPPPSLAIKRKQTETGESQVETKRARSQASSEPAQQPKKLEGVLKSVVAYCDSEDDDDDDNIDQ